MEQAPMQDSSIDSDSYGFVDVKMGIYREIVGEERYADFLESRKRLKQQRQEDYNLWIESLDEESRIRALRQARLA